MNYYFEIIDLFDKIRSTSSRNEKKDLLRSVSPELRLKLVEIFQLIHDPYTYFYASYVDEKRLRDIESVELVSLNMIYFERDEISELINILSYIGKNAVKGNSCLGLLKSYVTSFPHALQFLNYCLQSDFELGIQYNSLHEVFPEFEIPFFDVKLCQTYSEPITGKYFCEEKIDGLRCDIIPVLGVDELMVKARSGKPLYNCDLIVKEIKENVENWSRFVYDGEIFMDSWNSSMSVAKSMYPHPDADKLKLRIFDVIPVEEWRSGQFALPQYSRTALVDMISDKCDHIESLGKTRRIIDFNSDMNSEIQKEWIMHITNEFIEKYGSEGIVLKKYDAPYSFDRNSDWLKNKLWITEEFRIIEVYEGCGRLANTAGGILIDVNGVETGTGTGLNDDMRDYLWKNRFTLPDTYVEIEYQVGSEIDKLTGKFKKSFRTSNGSLRFPVFVRLRTDK